MASRLCTVWPKLWGLAACVLTGLGLAGAPAQAAPGWLPPVTLSPSGLNASSPHVAVDAAGETVIVWSGSDGANTIIWASFRAPGGGFGPPVRLSAPGGDASSPWVAMNAAGDAVAVWQRKDTAGKNIVQASSRLAGGAFGQAQDLSAPGQDAFSPRAAIDPAGNAVAIWSRSDNTGHSIVQSAARPAGGTFGSAQDLSAAGQSAFEPGVGMSQSGEAVAVWRRLDGAGHSIVQAAVRPPAGSFSALPDVSPSTETALFPEVAVDSAGDAVVVWNQDSPGEFVEAAVRPAGGSFNPSVHLSEAGHLAEEEQVAIDPSGNALAVWSRSNGTIVPTQAAALPAGGTFGAPFDISMSDSTGSPQIALNPGGRAAAVWSGSTSPQMIRAVVRPAEADPFSAPVDVSTSDNNSFAPQLAMDPAGDVTVAWAHFDGAHLLVQVAGYDPVAPELRALSVPARGNAGIPASFAVSPFDIWGVAGTTWSFGDGTSASGAAVSHTYKKAGSYSVQVSATDLAGNASSATRTIAVGLGRPSLSRLRETHSVFAVARASTPLRGKTSRAHARGTTFSFRLDQAASLTVRVQRRTSGRRVGSRCRPASRRLRHRKRCTRWVTKKTLRRSAHAGANRLGFSGRFHRRALAPGAYRAVFAARTSVGSSKARSIRFRIVRR